MNKETESVINSESRREFSTIRDTVEFSVREVLEAMHGDKICRECVRYQSESTACDECCWIPAEEEYYEEWTKTNYDSGDNS